MTHEGKALQQNTTVEERFPTPLSVLQHQLNGDAEKEAVNRALAGLGGQISSCASD